MGRYTSIQGGASRCDPTDVRSERLADDDWESESVGNRLALGVGEPIVQLEPGPYVFLVRYTEFCADT